MDWNLSEAAIEYNQFNVSYGGYDLAPHHMSKRHLPKDVIRFLKNYKLNSTTCFNFTSLDYTVYNCEFVFSLFVSVVLCFVGFLGNSLTIAVLRRDRDPHRQISTNWLLKILAIVDLIFLVLTFILNPLRIIMYRSEASSTARDTFQYVMKYLFPFATVAHNMTIWIVVFITVDRYLAICRPMNPDWRSLRRVKIAVGVLFVLAVIYNIPHFIKIEVMTLESCETGELRPLTVPREFAWNDHYYQSIYQGVCDFLFRTVGPLVILVVLNVRIAWAIKKLNKKRREMTLQAKEEKSLTVMLTIVVMIFIICQLPFTALTFALKAVIFFPVRFNWRAYGCAIAVANDLIILNSAINFLVYCLIWKKFNRIFLRMVTCKEENGHGHS